MDQDTASVEQDKLDRQLEDAGKTRPRSFYAGADYYRDRDRPGK